MAEFVSSTVELVEYGAGGLSKKGTATVIERAADGSELKPSSAPSRSLFEQLKANTDTAAVSSIDSSAHKGFRPSLLTEEESSFIDDVEAERRRREEEVHAADQNDMTAFEAALAASRAITSESTGVCIAAPVLAKRRVATGMPGSMAASSIAKDFVAQESPESGSSKRRKLDTGGDTTEASSPEGSAHSSRENDKPVANSSTLDLSAHLGGQVAPPKPKAKLPPPKFALSDDKSASSAMGASSELRPGAPSSSGSLGLVAYDSDDDIEGGDA